ncbi:DUF6381 family protein [Streptomyces sp. NPDC005279]|uniref:DUF6381 family protein n=1 Tax=Streptomyces sp. NPDC005279 TaxID=3364712 RepID=UPI0036A92913
MSVAGEGGDRAQQMRAKAQELQDAADRATDPQERRVCKASGVTGVGVARVGLR